MGNNLDGLIQEYYQKKKSGWGFFEIRKELEGKNYPPETISAIIKSIDNAIIQEEIYNLNRSRKNEIKNVGIVLIVVGLGITLLTFLNVIRMNGRFVLAFGPLVGGFMMVSVSKRFTDSKNKFKSGSFFKGLKK